MDLKIGTRTFKDSEVIIYLALPLALDGSSPQSAPPLIRESSVSFGTVLAIIRLQTSRARCRTVSRGSGGRCTGGLRPLLQLYLSSRRARSAIVRNRRCLRLQLARHPAAAPRRVSTQIAVRGAHPRFICILRRRWRAQPRPAAPHVAALLLQQQRPATLPRRCCLLLSSLLQYSSALQPCRALAACCCPLVAAAGALDRPHAALSRGPTACASLWPPRRPARLSRRPSPLAHSGARGPAPRLRGERRITRARNIRRERAAAAASARKGALPRRATRHPRARARSVELRVQQTRAPALVRARVCPARTCGGAASARVRCVLHHFRAFLHLYMI